MVHLQFFWSEDRYLEESALGYEKLVHWKNYEKNLKELTVTHNWYLSNWIDFTSGRDCSELVRDRRSLKEPERIALVGVHSCRTHLHPTLSFEPVTECLSVHQKHECSVRRSSNSSETLLLNRVDDWLESAVSDECRRMQRQSTFCPLRERHTRISVKDQWPCLFAGLKQQL